MARDRLSNLDLAAKLQATGLKWLIRNSQPFRKFMWTILEAASIFETTHTPGHPDTSAHREGRRALGLLILDMLNRAEPEVLPLLWQEGNLLAKDVLQAQKAEELAPDEDAIPYDE